MAPAGQGKSIGNIGYVVTCRGFSNLLGLVNPIYN